MVVGRTQSQQDPFEALGDQTDDRGRQLGRLVWFGKASQTPKAAITNGRSPGYYINLCETSIYLEAKGNFAGRAGEIPPPDTGSALGHDNAEVT